MMREFKGEVMKDAAIIWIDGSGDLHVSDEDLLIDDSLTNYVIISLFTDRQVEPEELEDGQSQRGWWGDSYSDQPWGSRLWLIAREKSLQSVADDAEDYAYEALNWMIDDNLIDSVVATATRESSQNNGVTDSPVKDILHLNIALAPSDGQPQRTLKFIIGGDHNGL